MNSKRPPARAPALPRTSVRASPFQPMIPRIALLLALVTLTGCNTTPKKVELDENGKPVEYVTYTPTGSRLPVRVRKDQMKTQESQTARDQQALKEAQQRGGRVPSGN